jgi:hypothetical protein
MAIIRPPITGDYALDSFLDQLVSELSSTTFNSADLERTLLSIDSNSYSATLYMYIRTGDNEQPTAISSDLVYNYESGVMSLDGSAVTEVDGWSFNTPPNVLDGAYFWQSYIHISSETKLENINALSWSTPELVAADLTINGIPVPSTPTNFTAEYINSDTVKIAWVYNEEDTEHPGLYSELQQTFDNGVTWNSVYFFTAPTNTIEINGFKGVDVSRKYRIRAGNVLTGLNSAWSANKTITPVTPNKPDITSVTYKSSTDSHNIVFTYATNNASVQAFDLEVAYDNGVYERIAVLSPAARTAVVGNVSSKSEQSRYRIRALGFNGQYGAYSDVDANSTGSIVSPEIPTSLTFAQNAKNVGSLTWNMENVKDIIHFEIEESVGDEDNYTFVSTVQKVPGQLTYNYRRVGLASEDDIIYFRVRSVSLNRSVSDYTDSINWIPGVPNAPTNLTYTRVNKEEAKLEWDYIGNYSTVRNFIVQVRETGTSTFETAASVDGDDSQYIISGMSVKAKSFDYRVIAVSLYGAKSEPSSFVIASPSALSAPTDLTLQAVTNVGTVTAVRLNWQPPQDDYNQYSVVTAQLLHESDNEWKDVTTVPAESTSVEFQPSRQGVLTFRLRATAVNGAVSDYSDTASIYISGGSATDDAVYNGDSAFLSTRHYSVNSDDFVLSDSADLEVISGGTYSSSTNKLTGTSNTDLVFYWYLNVPSNSVDRQRHYYLNVDNIDTVSSNPSPWTIDKGNVLVEVLSSPSDTADFYINDGSGTDNYIYIGSNEAAADIRTYTDRQPNFMYADREYISLTMKRTFTFRQSGSTLIKITLKANANETAIIDLNSGNELRLEAFASELIDDYEDLSVTNDASDPDGTLWTFEENFEAAPKIFITPNIETTTWVTDKSAASCRIHATDDCTVDLTARGR